MFEELVHQIIQDNGIAVLEQGERLKPLLSSYAKGNHKREIRRFLQCIEAGCYRELSLSQTPEETKAALLARLEYAYMFLPEDAAAMVNLLAALIEGYAAEYRETVGRLEKAALDGDYHAKYALAGEFERLNRYDRALYWLKDAAQQCISLYEAARGELLRLKEEKQGEAALKGEGQGGKEGEKEGEKQKEETQKEAAQKDGEAAKAEMQGTQRDKSPQRGEEAAGAEHGGAPAVPKDFAQGLMKDFVKIEAGEFMMGSPETEAERLDNEIYHRVALDGFYIGKYAVTQQEYERIMGVNPSHFKGGSLPVENVNWFDAAAYCNARSISEGFAPLYIIKGEIVRWNRHGAGYRLPTEAEWEYACRAGTASPFSTGEKITTDQANYDGTYSYNKSAKETYRETTLPAGSFEPNQWGVFDMHGNVWEWCWDWYGPYNLRNTVNPAGPSSGSSRIIRGGSWGGSARYLRSANRCSNVPFSRDNYLGFRVILHLEKNG
ncbi:MAG: formylglycine-generating enzyme family protein [Spirochaetaceae bacterium]|jgi:formylglycine-generating enzyme required for sulfatase activity|nr:formylglycine-generating enzyme family protein [Spirochaetaceae bacterium]